MNEAINASAVQNNGEPNFARVCQPELKTCSTAIFFTGKDGKGDMVKTTEDSNGKLISREMCEFNQFGDVRVFTLPATLPETAYQNKAAIYDLLFKASAGRDDRVSAQATLANG